MPPDASPGPGDDARRIRRLILVLGLGSFSGALAMRVTDPFVAVIAGEFAVAPETAALLGTAFALPYAGVQPVLGPVGDAIGKRRVIGWGLLGLALALLAFALAPSFRTLFAARVLAGAAAGGVMPLSLAAIGDAVPLGGRQLALSRLLVFAITGQVTGGALAGVLAGSLGWRGVVALCAGAALLAGIVTAAAARRGPPEPRVRFDPAQALGRYRVILTTRAALVLFGAVAVEGVLIYGTFPYFALLLGARGIGGVTEAGLAVGAFGVGGFVYAASARLLLARLGQGRMVRLGGALGGLALLGLALAPGWGIFAGSALCLGVGFYMIHNSIQTRVTEVAPAARGSAVALHAFSFFAGQSLGPVIYGLGFGSLGVVATLTLSGVGVLLLGVALGSRPR
jgi:predicted MFS family arabinose efflux permease